MAGVYDYTPAPKARRFAILFAIITAFFCILSQMSINVGAKSISLLMLPTLVIYLWPRGANPVLSLIGIVIAGFSQDYLSYGPLGMWSFTWLLFFLIYRPDIRIKPDSFLWQWAGAFLVLVSISLVQWTVGRFMLGQAVEFQPLVLSSVAAAVIFPFMLLVRVYFARMAGESDDFYYERPAR